jgi:hypothetical protein
MPSTASPGGLRWPRVALSGCVGLGDLETDEMWIDESTGSSNSSVSETTLVNGAALLVVVLIGLIFVFFRHWPKAQSGP